MGAEEQCKRVGTLKEIDRLEDLGVDWTTALNLVCRTDRRGAYRALVGKTERRRPLGRPRRKWEDNIKMDLREFGWGGIYWIDLALDSDRWRAVVYTVMNLWIP
jgi:hypothetical protein